MGASAVAAVIIAKERRIVDSFRDAGATSPARAITTQQAGISENIGFTRLRDHEVIREANPGFFYLDEPVWLAVRRTRRRLAIALLMIAVFVALSTTLVTTLGFLTLK
jgi:hypothetical protein